MVLSVEYSDLVVPIKSSSLFSAGEAISQILYTMPVGYALKWLTTSVLIVGSVGSYDAEALGVASPSVSVIRRGGQRDIFGSLSGSGAGVAFDTGYNGVKRFSKNEISQILIITSVDLNMTTVSAPLAAEVLEVYVLIGLTKL